jgi:hypothetical protein
VARARARVAVTGVAKIVAPITAATATLRKNEAERDGECMEGNIWSLLSRRRRQDYLLILLSLLK